MKAHLFFVLLWVAVLSVATPAFACDPCALNNASRLQGHAAGAFTFSVYEQYTNFDRAQNSDDTYNEGDLVRGFSITQFSLAYDLTQRAGLQVTLPLITRRFDQAEHDSFETKSDSGLGDLSLAGSYAFIDYKDSDWALIAGLTGGVKFPSGDTGVLEHDASGDEVEAQHHEEMLRHHPIGASSEGRALSLGSGSYDYILGLDLLSRYQRYLVLANAQYTIRTEGDFEYEFADDFLSSIGSGYYFLLDHESSIAGLVSLSSENKGNDHRSGELVPVSAISNLYLGPELIMTLDEVIGAQIGIDFRVTEEDAGSTVVPTNRLRASISYRF